MSSNKFVFVVCGSREHIDTLHFSLNAIKRFSKNEIIVVTDSARNEIPVQWGNIIEIKTSEHFNNHQASIYLKTGLYKFLPEGNSYCYLDTDIVALSEKADDIFKHYVPPITFCSDHCRLDAFSPYAVNCGCVKIFESKHNDSFTKKKDTLKKLLDEWSKPVVVMRRKLFQELLEYYHRNQFNSDALNEDETKDLKEILEKWRIPYELKDRELVRAQSRLLWLFSQLRRKPLLSPFYLYRILRDYRRTLKGEWYDRKGNLLVNKYSEVGRYLLEFPGYWLDKPSNKIYNARGIMVRDLSFTFQNYISKFPEFVWDEHEQKWYDSEGNLLFDTLRVFEEIFAEKGFIYERDNNLWYDKDGNVLFEGAVNLKCTHLHDFARDKFNVKITPADWQHWNGGVFLFNDRSREFLDFWHHATLKIFEDPQWRTRDQGTLAVSAWKFGLQNHALLPLEFNFIADYYHHSMVYLGDLTFDIDKKKKNIKPHLIHIYHHWEDTTWDVWNDVAAFVSRECVTKEA